MTPPRDGRGTPLRRLHLTFEWDDAKAAVNQQKQGVSFVEASTSFGDLLAITRYDPDHSEREDRFVTLGRSDRQRLLTEAYTERGVTIRWIFARPATRRGLDQYEQPLR